MSPAGSLPPLTRLPSGAVVHASGPPGGPQPRLLFLHGVGGAAWSWAPQVQVLQRHAPCLVWEARGHGASARVADAGLADYAQDAREALDAAWAARAQPLVLVAHSMGAMLAFALACETPQRVQGLFLVDPVYAETGSRPAALKPVLGLLCRVVSPLVRSYQRDGALSRLVSRQFFRRAFLDAAAMERAWALQRQTVPLEYPRMLYESIAGVTGFDFQPFADRVAAPACIVEARQRPRSRPRLSGLAARLSARGPGPCAHVVLDGGHYLQLDKPDAVTGQLLAFTHTLAGRSPPGGSRETALRPAPLPDPVRPQG